MTNVSQGSASLARTLIKIYECISNYPQNILQETLSKYLKTVPQFLDKREFEATVEAVKELGQQGGDGERLQILLEEKASKSENWASNKL